MLEIINIPIGDIRAFKNNAKLHPKEQINQIIQSIRAFGFNDPIAVSEDNEIIEGHGRLLAVKELGYTVPCIRLSHLTEEQRRAYILAHNKLTMNTGFDTETLLGEFDFLRGADFNSELTGFSMVEIEKLFSENNLNEVKDDDFDLSAAIEKAAFVLPRDVWTLGRHRLMCGDSTKSEDVERLMDGKSANCVLTDPPYGIFYDKSKVGTIKNDDLQGEKLYQFLLASFVQMEKAMANDACIYVFHADTEGLNFRKAFDDADFKMAACCIWNKNAATFGRSDWKWKHEPILYGWKKSGKHIWHGDQKQTSVWDCDKPSKSELHPTQKPIPLLAIPLKNSTVTNSIVLDPFAGSASTLICCEQLGRICYTMELDEKYASASIKRFVKEYGSDDVSVERDGQILKYSEVVTCE